MKRGMECDIAARMNSSPHGEIFHILGHVLKDLAKEIDPTVEIFSFALDQQSADAGEVQSGV